ncbi:hypothetical protein NLU13_2807 [Sarocladium strictum]|uniref:DUF1740-domain-containing protein n=1 Tax=Sarocladium strictum TaxID=5046 RepID=A0AA39GNI2_SARSR|nr:hypothetical protein NLU13_2807 [Sarocladium strictum]
MAEPQGDDGPKLTVPKFASFKAKEPSKSGTHPPSFKQEHHHRSRDSRKERRRDRHDVDQHSSKSRHQDDDKSRRERPRKVETRSPSPSRSHQHHKRGRSDVAEGGPDRKRPQPGISDEKRGVEGLYVIDTKGDPLLKKYGNNVHYYVPSSYRYPPGRVLGAEGRLYIHRDGTREQFSILQPGERPDSSRHSDSLRSRWPRAHPDPVRLRPLPISSGKEDENPSFLQIGKPKKRKPRQPSGSDTSGDEADLAYRSIEGKMKAKPISEDESKLDSDAEVDIHQDNPLRWRSVQLNLRVKEHPEDIDSWLELVDHQDALLKSGHSIDQSLHENEVHSYAEIKVSLLESALSYAKSKDDRQRVLVLLMREGSKVWDRKTAAKRWAGLSEEERSSFELWKADLDFRMSDVANFQYEDIKNLFLARLKFLVADALTSADTKERYEEAVYVFLRMTRMISDAGYGELAFSAWQALIELNMYRPAGQDDFPSSLDSFQDFWESEVPRFGEAGAHGWRHFVETNGAEEPAETPTTNSAGDDELTTRDPYKLWTALEQRRGREARIPARTLDEGNDDDPFRVVMFSDIEQMVFSIPKRILEEITDQLVDAFLVFAGLPPAVRSNAWTQLAAQDPHVVSGSLRTRALGEQSASGDDDSTKRPPPFDGRMIECLPTSSTLIPGPSWFHYLPTSHGEASVPRDVVERALGQVIQIRNIPGLAEYLLAISHTGDPVSIKKQAKTLLKQYPTNISLFVAYALAESSNGNNSAVQKTLASAAEISTQHDLALVIRAWAWIELERRNRAASLRVLCSAAEPILRRNLDKQEAVTSSQILKASQMFESEIHAALYSGSSDTVSLYGECALLLAYLTSTDSKEPSSAAQGGIEAAMEVTSKLSHELSRRSMRQSTGHEKLLQAASRVLYWHAANGPFRRIFLREKLSAFVEAFPRNGIFLSLLEWSDSGLRVIDETRQLLHEKSLSQDQDCFSTRVFAIQHELERGNTNSARAAFEGAVTSDACKASPCIWTWYIEFSYSQRSLRTKAKEVFYRALRHCPWSKQVMMQAFTTLIRIMESTELKAVYETMTSKGIRIHVEMDDYLQMHEAKRSRERGQR